jgi:hypothetical protein
MNRCIVSLSMIFSLMACAGSEDSGTSSGPTPAQHTQTLQKEKRAAMRQATEEIADNFEDIALRWEQHCRERMPSSNFADRLETPAYEDLVQLGRPAVPLIFKRWGYHDDDEKRPVPWMEQPVPWYFALDDITGVQMIPDRMAAFSPREVKDKWLDWWEKTGKKEYGL